MLICSVSVSNEEYKLVIRYCARKKCPKTDLRSIILKTETVATLPLCTVRVLKTYAETSKFEPSTERAIKALVETHFGKAYSEQQIKDAHDELIRHGLLQTIAEKGTKTFLLTQKGLSTVQTITRLAKRQPDPWRRFTRKSYSQNVAPA